MKLRKRSDNLRIAAQECSEELAVSGLLRGVTGRTVNLRIARKNWQFQDCRAKACEKEYPVEHCAGALPGIGLRIVKAAQK